MDRTRTPGTRPRLAVVLPAYNEAANLGAVLARLGARGDAELIVVDDHSDDDTAKVALSYGATLLSMPFRFGAWTAAQTGMRYAYRHGYDVVVTMDADGQHHPEHIDTVLAPIVAGEADVVIGACVDRASKLRRFAWRYLRLLSGLTIVDLTSGFRAYSRPAVGVAASWAATSFDYQDLGLLLLLRRKRMRIVERDVEMDPRRDGKSRVFSSWVQVARYMAVSSVLGASKRGRDRLPTVTH
jgi:glycosyltransferase involved in cell wall biosynthesis